MASASNAGSGEPRQRWRLVFARDAAASGSLIAAHPTARAFGDELERHGLALGRGSRPSIALAAPLPTGIAGEHELADIFLADRRPMATVKQGIKSALSVGHRFVDLYDVWLGEPPLPAQVRAADYRLELANPIKVVELAGACARLLARPLLPRERRKGDRTVGYDLRPLIIDLAVDEAEGTPVLDVRTRISSDQGSGRPDEVVAALADEAGVPLEVARATRTRIWLASEL